MEEFYVMLRLFFFAGSTWKVLISVHGIAKLKR